MYGREVVIANINGKKIPFYKSSSGTDGKVKGNWYPFFGFGHGARGGEWLIKGNISDMSRGYDIKEIHDMQKLLNSNFPWTEQVWSRTTNGVQNPYFGKQNITHKDVNRIFGSEEELLDVFNGINAEKHIYNFLSNFKNYKMAVK